MTLTVVSAACSPGLAAEAKWTSLFDGKSFNGWVVPSGPDAENFSIRDGVIHIEGSSGWIHTSKKFSNFTLKAMVRFVSEGGTGNTGIFMRSPETSIFGKNWPGKSFEVESRDMTVSRASSPPWMGQILRLGGSGGGAPEGMATFDSAAAVRAYKTTGEWNNYEVIAEGDRIWAFLNGELTSTVWNVAQADGHIGLQSETGASEFKSLEISEHGIHPPDGYTVLFDGKDLSKWKVDDPRFAGNFSLRDHFLHIEGEGGWLRSADRYGDFKMQIEFRTLSAASMDGLLLRTPGDKTYDKGWPSDSVEVQLRPLGMPSPTSLVSDPRWIGAILRHATSEGLNMFDTAAALKANKGIGE